MSKRDAVYGRSPVGLDNTDHRRHFGEEAQR